MYSADVQLLQRLLRSPHRTLDPEQADFFYVPLMLSLGFMTHRFGIYLPSATSAQIIDAVVAQVKFTLPYWNRTNGADHLMTFTGDDGSTWLRGRSPQLEPTIFLTHYGFQCNDAKLRDLWKQRPSAPSKCVQQVGFRPHRSGHDIVLPPLHRPHDLLPASLWMEPSQPEATARLSGTREYKYLLYFVGKVNRSKREGDIYSGGVRQRVYDQHAHRPDFYVRWSNGGKFAREDAAAMSDSKFCLAPYGTGFGMREFDSLLLGCVPVLITPSWEDDEWNGGTMEGAFAEVVPWSAIAIKLTRGQIPQLPAILESVSAQAHAAMVRAAACVWPRLFWTPTVPAEPTIATLLARVKVEKWRWPFGLPTDQDCGEGCRDALRQLASHDAFATLMSVLEKRLRRRWSEAASTSSLQGRMSPPPPDGLMVQPTKLPLSTAEIERLLAEEARMAEVAGRLEIAWANSTRDLRRAPWLTPAASCLRALEMEVQAKRSV